MPESLTECLEGEVGEIWVSGPSVAQGYWGRPEQTEQTFHAHLPRTGEGPFLRTGDLGFILEGELFITGRLKDLIIIDGQNHYPQDIEMTVENSHFALRPGCCAAVSIDLEGRERLVVVAELERSHRNVDRSEIVKAIRQAVAEQHELRVDHTWLLDPGGIPKTSSGKIQRHACRAGFLALSDNKSHLNDGRRHGQDAR
jgi:acyl-CoA synthetase (AMP-forming)/AMP-acid ligase II